MGKELQIWGSPFKDLWGLKDDIDKLFWGTLKGYREGEEEACVWSPVVDIKEDENEVKVSAELPGLKQKDIKVTVNEGMLTIKGERKFEDEEKKKNYHRIERCYGSFSRSFSLPSNLEAEKIKASMNDGILEVTIPKKEEKKPKEISIEVK